MSDASQLLLIVVGVYIVECLVAARTDGIVLVPWWPGLYRIVRPFSIRGSRSLGVVLAPPWPPLSPALASDPWPFELVPEGVRLRTNGEPASDDVAPIPWEEIHDVETDGRLVVAGGRRLGECGSSASAERLAAVLLQAASGNAATRPGLLLAIVRARFDVTGTRKAIHEAERASRVARAGGTGVVLGIGVLGPVALFTDVPFSGWVALTVMVAGWWTAAGAALMARRRLGLGATQLVSLCFSPLSAARAGDLYFRHLTVGLEPMAAAVAVGSPDAHRLSRETLADWTLRVSSRGRWLPTQLAAAATEVLKQEGLDPTSLFASPESDGAGSCAYCPRCMAQFIRRAEHCPTCGDVPMRDLSIPPSVPGAG